MENKSTSKTRVPVISRRRIGESLSLVFGALMILSFQNCGFRSAKLPGTDTASTALAAGAAAQPAGSGQSGVATLASPTPAPANGSLPSSTPTPAPTPAPSSAPVSTTLIPTTPPLKSASPMTEVHPEMVTSIGTNQGQTKTLITEVAAGAGFKVQAVQNGSQLVWTEPGGYLEYNINIEVGGSYGLAIFNSASDPGTDLDLYVDGKLIAKRQTGGSVSGETVRTANALVSMASGPHKLKLVTGAQAKVFAFGGLQVNYPIDPLVNFGMIQDLNSSTPTVLVQDAVTDFYRLGLWADSNGNKSWGCVWSYCFVEFQVHSDHAAAYVLTIDYTQQSNANHACASLIVNGSQQRDVEMFSPSGHGQTAPQTLQLPAGTSRLRIANENYYNGVFCFGANFSSITLAPVL